MKPWTELDILDRWRLLLGEAGQTSLGPPGDGAAAVDGYLSWLYGRAATDGADGAGGMDGTDDTNGSSRDKQGPDIPPDRQGGDGASQLTVPEWINGIHELFPKETIERLERDAIERYGIDEVVTNIEVLERAVPNFALLQAVLRTKHLMDPDVLAMARELVEAVVRELMEKLAKAMKQAFAGTRKRQHLTLRGTASRFAAHATLKSNLRHYDVQRRRLVIQRPLFHINTRRVLEPWEVFLLVDQSGSMLGSVIHAAVTAACLWSLPGIKTHLIAFDNEVVDLTESVSDPVETLMGVQLGGGTNIGKAVAYAAARITVPRRAIVVVISDFFEGVSEHVLIGHARALVAQGSIVLGLAALDERADPILHRGVAAELVEAGASVAAMTPGELASWLAERLK